MPAVVAVALGMLSEAMMRLSKGGPRAVAPTHLIIKIYHVIQARNLAVTCYSEQRVMGRLHERTVGVEGRAEFHRLEDRERYGSSSDATGSLLRRFRVARSGRPDYRILR